MAVRGRNFNIATARVTCLDMLWQQYSACVLERLPKLSKHCYRAIFVVGKLVARILRRSFCDRFRPIAPATSHRRCRRPIHLRLVANVADPLPPGAPRSRIFRELAFGSGRTCYPL